MELHTVFAIWKEARFGWTESVFNRGIPSTERTRQCSKKVTTPDPLEIPDEPQKWPVQLSLLVTSRGSLTNQRKSKSA